MSYSYQKESAWIFTEEGQRAFLEIRDRVKKLLDEAGAFTMLRAMSVGMGGDSWQRMACIDRLVELGEIREVPRGNVAGQYRVFVGRAE